SPGGCFGEDALVNDAPRYFFFSSRRRHTRSKRDWSSDVCSSDLKASGPGCPGTGSRCMDGRPPEVGNDERLSARPPVWPPKQNAGSSGTGVSPCRGGGIRTYDISVPNEARYQAAPHAVATPPSLA